MIALSSHKPFEASFDYATNQSRAAKSWIPVFKSIFYIGHFEKELANEKSAFVKPEGEYPTIKEMASFAAHFENDFVAIINADIVLDQKGMAEAERRMVEMALPAATSYRYEFNSEDYPNLDNAVRHKEDRGMDIFIANPAIWKMVEKEVPESLWFGHPTWDSWVCGFFCHNLGFGFRQFTDLRCVFHPKHGGRLTPNSSQIKSDSPYFTRAKRPSPL